MTITTQIKIAQTREVARTASNTTTSTITDANTNVQPQVQIKKSRPLSFIPHEKQCSSKQGRNTEEEKGEDFTSYENQDIKSYDKLVAESVQ